MPTACQNTSQLLRQRVILIHVEHLWIILSREVNDLRLSHFISTKGNSLIDLKVLEVIHASPQQSASRSACLSGNIIAVARWPLLPRFNKSFAFDTTLPAGEIIILSLNC